MTHLFLFTIIIAAIVTWCLGWWKFWLKRTECKEDALFNTFFTTVGSFVGGIIVIAIWVGTA